MNIKNREAGMSILVSVIIIAAAALIIAANSAVIGQSELDISVAGGDGAEALANAETCAYEGLGRLKRSPVYLVDSLSLPLDNGLCTLKITASSSDRLIKASSEINSYYREINAEVIVATGSIMIYDWREY